MVRPSLRLFSTFALLLMVLPVSGARAEPGFDLWLKNFRAEAAATGLSARTLDQALGQATFLDRVIELDRRQPEGSSTFASYSTRMLSADRVSKGKAMRATYRALLEQTAQTYGVPAKYIVALWGMETVYGANIGNTDVISALATLAYEGRRHDFFKAELFKALQILEAGDIREPAMIGSWAGAMGQCQFMPSTFLNFAVDGDGDGKRDIWNSLPDVFASTANYLARSGWNGAQSWGREVKLTRAIPAALVGPRLTPQSLAAWDRLGVVKRDGTPLPEDPAINATLVQPDGPTGRSFLAYDNYRVLMQWNRSTYFATAVGLLADQLGN